MPTLTLPPIIDAYFEADRLGSMSIVECFADNAVVKDESHAYHGREAIRRWRAEAAAKYTYTCQPLDVTQQGNQFRVNCHLEGSFPGSPIELGFCFEIDNDQITTLEIQ
ncbi:nuclear transport factor 2 family protein [Aeoliella sp. SH292]|uniref:nuclear transport factor 2 family protein n=1 Tax=Aeoliella sp. SH292 TaxID=3454464 RepID=UPI003F99776A